MKHTLIAFDWDGTLMDSTGQIVRCMQNAAAECGLDVPEPGAIQHIIGLSLPKALIQLFPDRNEHERDMLLHAYGVHFRAEPADAVDLFPGVRAMVNELAPYARLVIATGKSRLGLDRVLQQVGWTDRFADSRCADETHSKPDPRMLLELLRACPEQPDQCLMIGDTTYDLDMARAAGMQAWAVSWGAHPPELLRSRQPDRIFNTVSELDAALHEVCRGDICRGT